MGHILSSNGIKIDSSKMKAIAEMKHRVTQKN